MKNIAYRFLIFSLFATNLLYAQEHDLQQLSTNTNIATPTNPEVLMDEACPNPPPPGAESCVDACIYCDLNGFMGINNGSPSGGNTVCGQISIHNDQWFGFIAGSSSITIDIITSNCEQGNGLQFAIFEDCDDADALICNPGCTGCGGNTFSITYSNFTAGETYYLMIDGWTGDVCDFEIQTTDGSITPPPPDPALQPMGPTMVCPGAEAVYSVPYAFGAGFYHWTSPPGSSINGGTNNVFIDAPGGSEVTITFANAGGQVCVATGSVCYAPGMASCLSVTNQPIPPTVRAPLLICNSDLPFTWDEAPYPTLTNSGSFPLTSTPYDSYLGCDSLVKQTIIIQPALITMLPPQVLCEGQCLQIGGDSFCNTGSYSVIIPSYQGCDSLVNFSLTILKPVADILGSTQILCEQSSIILTSANSLGDKIWRDTSGGILSMSDSLTVTQAGIYILSSNMSAGSVVCSKSDTVVVTAHPMLIAVQINADTLGCEIDSLQLSCTTTVGNPQFLWSGPNGFSSSEISPLVTSPGQYSVIVSTVEGCMGVDTSIVIAIFDIPDAFASGDVLTCLDTIGQLNGGSNTPDVTFFWTGPNGFQSAEEDPIVLLEGDYVLTVRVSGGCTNTAIATLSSNLIDLVIHTDTIIHPTTGQNNGSIFITPSSGSALFSYVWTLNGAQIADTEDVSNLGPGLYTVVVTDAFGCFNAEDFLLETTSNTSDISGISPWLIRPNPSSGLFELSCTDGVRAGTQILVYDYSGRLMQDNAIVKTQKAFVLDLTTAPNGVYLVEIRDASGSIWAKLVVQR